MKRISIICGLLCFMLGIGAVPFGVYAKETELALSGEAPVYYIETYEQLRNHASKAQADCRYILDADIVQDDNLNNLEIVVPAGAVFNLDLNGYNIQRSTQGNDCALFRVKSDGRMTINDTSVNKTGGCCFSEGYSDYYKAVFYNDGGELEIYGGYYEILSPYEQGDCSIVRTTSGYTNIYDGTFDSSASWGGDTITVGHYAYLYDVPQVVIFGGEFYGKYSNIDVTPFDNYLNYSCLFPSVYVLGGNFYVTKESENTGFAYCNNGWGRVIVAEGTVLCKCLNSIDQRFVEGVSKKLFMQTIDDYKEGYYDVTAPPMIMSEGLDYYYRLIGKCDKEMVNSYGTSVYELHKEQFDEIQERIDTVMVSETDKVSPQIKLENRTKDHIYVNWYMCDEASYNGANTEWTYLGDYYNVSQWQFDERPEEATSYIIRCVLTNSDLTTYEDMVRIVYMPLEEDEVVSSAITEPASSTEFTEASKPTLSTEATEPSQPTFSTEPSESSAPASSATPTESLEPTYTTNSTVPSSSSEPTETTAKTEPTETTAKTEPNETTGEAVNTTATEVQTKPTEPEKDKGILGDVNGDGKVNIKDATQIQKFAAKLLDLTEDEKLRADVNSDGKVNVKDATAIQKYVAKIETGYPVGLPI